MLHDILEFINPEYLLRTYGVAVIFLIVFVETGLMCFFLPGDSLLVTAGFFCAAGLFRNHEHLGPDVWLVGGDHRGQFDGLLHWQSGGCGLVQPTRYVVF